MSVPNSESCRRRPTMSARHDECCRRRGTVNTRVRRCEGGTRIRKELGTNSFL